MGQVERQFNNCQKKLDNALAELENSAREGREFEQQCNDAMAWLHDMEGLLSEKLQVSAERQTLISQVNEFEPIYKEIMSKEHEIIMVLNRGQDVMSRASKADAGSIKQKKMSAAEQELALTEAALNQDQPQLNHVQLALRVIFMGLVGGALAFAIWVILGRAG